MKLALEP